MKKNEYFSLHLPVKAAIVVLFLLFGCLASSGVFAQQVLVTGHVQDENGLPLQSVSVTQKGSAGGTSGTVTDADGNYQLNVSSKNAVLVFSFVGYGEKQLSVADSKNVILTSSSNAMDSVVIIGYGSMKKTDVTGSVTSVKASDLLSKPVSNVLEGLQGRVAGVNVSLNSGAPGGLASVIIRGIGSINSSTDPLYVVDGVAMTNIQYLNPYDIQSMEVLKDASATSIYGARGSNGVILITTKRGATSNGTVVSYDFSVSAGNLPKELPTLNSEQFLEVLKGGMANNPLWGAAPRTLKTTDPLLFDANGKPLYNTDWQKEVTRTAISNNHQLSIQHRGENSSTGVFLNYSNNEGIMLNSALQRYNIRFAHDLKMNDWINFGVNLMANYSKEHVVNPGTGGNTPTRVMIEMPSIFPVKFPDGSWANNQSSADYSFLDAAENPVKVLLSQTNTNNRSQVFGNVFFNFHLTKDLQFKTQFGVDYQDIRNDYYSPSDLMNISANQKGVANVSAEQIRYWQQENYLTYDKQLGQHHINVVAGASWQERVDQMLSGSTQNFSDDYYRQYNLGAGSQPNPPGSNYGSWAINSYFARASYNYAGKYLLTLTGRADGSSRFGKTNKYGYFPSVGVGYILSEEPFIKNIKAISYLKLRGSYGSTGNTEIGSYQSLATVSSGTTLINGNREPSSYINGLPNPDLRWEKTRQTDIGMELQLFNSRVALEADYYYKLTSDLLLNKPIPTSTGFGGVLSNIGSMSNRGVDLALTTKNIDGKNFSWQTNFVANYNKNEVVSLGSNNEDIFPGPFWGPVSNGFTILRVGEPAGSFWGYERLGTYSSEEVAAALAKDPNFPYHAGEEKESAEKKILGKGTPDWTGSFVNTFRYKNFDLMIDLQFSQGASIAQAFLFSSEDRTGYSNSLTSVMNAWTPDNQNTPIQQWRFAPDAGQSAAFDSHWVANGSFIRGRNVVLGYQLDSRLAKSLKMSRLRLYISGQNLFLIKSDSYKGYDPENVSWNTPGSPPFGQNIEFYQYPKARTLTFGLNASF
ncbi:MAG TPA: TonB-dependent receptor [Arachidicoccus sp.]|nr:TonB-dependent receptor [Arachidicoccus sp.]